ncbi:MAG: hypothetical protein H3C68_08265 [Deltaproteobacteria bacterium]|nr:hypothetical protein [Deltaproteobacteria bacterium]MBZ0219361.1 hypothetical protein [Deltaproteobacteria bacterium]
MRLDRIYENKDTMRLLKWAFYAAVIIFVGLDFVIPRHHLHFYWDEIPGFSAVFGFISCVLIIIVSKALGKLWLQRKEDYYEK